HARLLEHLNIIRPVAYDRHLLRRDLKQTCEANNHSALMNALLGHVQEARLRARRRNLLRHLTPDSLLGLGYKVRLSHDRELVCIPGYSFRVAFNSGAEAGGMLFAINEGVVTGDPPVNLIIEPDAYPKIVCNSFDARDGRRREYAARHHLAVRGRH